MKVEQFIPYDLFKNILSFTEFCIVSVGGYQLFIWLGAYINYEVVKFLIAVLTAMAIGASSEFGKKMLFPFLSRVLKLSIVPYFKEKYSKWKKSKNS